MRNGFKDALEIKQQAPKDKPKDGKNYPLGWDFRCPQYDERSSCYVNAGTYYGVGRTNPVGTFSDASEYAVPLGKVKTKEIYPHEKPIA